MIFGVELHMLRKMSISLLCNSFLVSVDCEEGMMCDETGESILLGEKSRVSSVMSL